MKTLENYLEEFVFKFHGLSQPNRTKTQTRDDLKDFLSTMYRELEEAKDEELREQAEQNDFNNS